MQFNEEKLSSPSINLVSILDSLFILLFVFMFLLLNMTQKYGLDLSLPQSPSSQKLPQNQAITIELGSQQSLYIQNKKVSLNELAQELEYISLELPRQALIIKGDQNTPLGRTIQVLDLAKKHGFKNVTIETSKN